jgi:hypothetical protein
MRISQAPGARVGPSNRPPATITLIQQSFPLLTFSVAEN